ncbi:hypothetical protein A3A45_00925 [Candidatus Daviesbacteria bacterium RIFCSPLOWO2_01_FULL_36_8]|nr:MAG: hypothetical protein A3A45_00925 [Candidatus Daviesbacteria bacterium RIFCSPLOWO2_01_FULL_36_8]
MHIPAIILGKAIAKITRLLKIGGGSAAPGLYALKVDPNLVSKLSKKIPKNIIITGTNGKTTTSRMIAHFAKAGGLKVIRNHTGSNLERGIASALISNYTLYPKPYTLDLGIWELDEAAFNNVAPKLNPDIVVFLNIFRDQLDRYGEVDSVVKKWAETLKKLDPKTIVLVNGDDANTAKLGSFKFGVKNQKIKGEIPGKKEQLNCWIKNVKLNGLSGSSFDVVVHNKSYPVKLPLPGLYHIYDFLAAFYAGHELGFDTNKMISSLKTFTSTFGRVEKLPFGYIFLIKNPEGATQVFKTIAPTIKEQDRILLALNDNLADGTDVSWIWDGDFEKLLTPSLRPRTRSGGSNLFVSGSRAQDMALRLKYAGFEPKQIIVDPSLENALRQARKGLKGTLYILPTYTAMLDLQRILAKIGLKKEYWNEK